MSTTRRTTLLFVLATAAGSACITGRAQTPTDRPALDVPDPPARVVAQVPAPEPTPAPIDPVDDLGAANKPASPTRTNKPPVRPDPPKADPKPETPPATTDPPQTAPPTPQLKLPGAADQDVVSRQLRDQVERTRRTLGAINRARLPARLQRTYDDAQGFVKQAEDALNARNLVFAKELADKAERLAKELQSR